jgi:PIN domain nuclease of toxin-antitoxin system
VLLLDTHVWLWAAEGIERRIGPRSRQLLVQWAEDLAVSTASVFEVAALHTAGRLRLARPPEQWVRESVDAAALQIVDVSSSIAIDAGSIPRTGLEDPMDRLIVATARQENATLMTADAAVLAYAADTRNVRVHDARR